VIIHVAIEDETPDELEEEPWPTSRTTPAPTANQPSPGEQTSTSPTREETESPEEPLCDICREVTPNGVICDDCFDREERSWAK
jgi:hypothetical protein